MPAFVRLPSPASGSLLLGYLPHQERQSTGQKVAKIKMKRRSSYVRVPRDAASADRILHSLLQLLTRAADITHAIDPSRRIARLPADIKPPRAYRRLKGCCRTVEEEIQQPGVGREDELLLLALLTHES